MQTKSEGTLVHGEKASSAELIVDGKRPTEQVTIKQIAFIAEVNICPQAFLKFKHRRKKPRALRLEERISNENGKMEKNDSQTY
jgi:hypothetical protein